MQINIKDIWSFSVRRTHKKYVNDILSSVASPSASPMLDKLLANHRYHLATGRPARLREIIASVNAMKSSYSEVEYDRFLVECKAVFDYKKFSDKKTKGWNAYGLCGASPYQTCPYCQQAGALTIYRCSDEKAFRPTLDHFYPKGQYPFLALSLYNLVPSCYSCNSSLKSTSDFYEEPHLHPFEDEELIRFEWDVDEYIKQREGAGPMAGSLSLTGVKLTPLSDAHPMAVARKNSISKFLIEERLELNITSLRRFQDTLVTYSPERLAEANRRILTPAGWTLTEEQALQFSYNDYKNEWFGRLKADLYDAAWRRNDLKPKIQ